MSKEDWEDIPSEELNNDDDINEAPIDDDGSAPSGKYDKLLNSDSRKFKLSGMFKDWFLDYSSYVILQRAVPHIVDGLKPVQRRVLHAMFNMDSGSYTKVANIIGQAMQYHPHGDSSIEGALVQLGQKGLLIDCQGNWGNILTGDRNAAPRYIEARLSKFAKEVVFDPKVTNWMTSYDGRNQEPTELPVRFPLLLAQGTEGIAVGMASKILPHNFNELIDASIAILQGKDFEIYPDFPTGGSADCSKYNKGGRGGFIKVRAKIEKIDKNTLTITEIPFGKTTKVLIDSILKARDKGKIKIKKIEDMTTDKADILIHLPNDVSPDKTIDALYAFTDCETTIAPNACVIKDNKPQFLTVDDILIYDTNHTRDLLGQELQIKMNELENDWHYTSLERIFFENRVYKILEQDQKSWEQQLDDVFATMKSYQEFLHREIIMEDIMRLVEKPVRKISKFDTKAIDEKISGIESDIAIVKDQLAHLTEYTIKFFKNIKEKYGKPFKRLTEITSFETIQATKVVNNNAKLYANMAEGFVGIGLKRDDNGEYISDCSDLSEIIVIGKDGKYRITKVSDKTFFGKNLLYVGVFNRGDERSIYNVIYRDGKSSIYFAKRFAVTSITRDKDYDITQGTPGSAIVWFTANHNGEAESVKIFLRPRPKLKKLTMEYDFSTLSIKGKTSRGNLVTKNAIHRIAIKSQGVSTIGGKDIWYDADIQRLNEDSRGQYLGQFNSEDKILAIFKDGTFYTTSFDLSNRYQGEVLKIEKLDTNKNYSLVYYNGSTKSFYVKRFSFDVSDNTPISLISDGKGSFLVGISDDKHPRIMVTFGGNYAQHDPETIEVEDFIGKKGLAAKGKMCSSHDTKKVEFIEPLHKPEDDIVPSDEPTPQNLAGDIEDTEDDSAVDGPAEAIVGTVEDVSPETNKSEEEQTATPNEIIDIDAIDILNPNLELVNPEAEENQPKKTSKPKKSPAKDKKSDDGSDGQDALDIEPTLF